MTDDSFLDMCAHNILQTHIQFLLRTGEMDKSNCAIAQRVETNRKTMMKVKASNIGPSLLRRVTHLKILGNKTCKWTAKAIVTNRFVKLFDSLARLTTSDNFNLEFDTGAEYKKKCKRDASQWNSFASLHGRLQESGLTRNKGQMLVDKLHQVIQANKSRPSHSELTYSFLLSK